MRRAFNFLIYRVPLVMPALMFFLKRVQYALLSFYKEPEDVRLIRTVAREKRMLLQPLEAHTILALARMQSSLEGDLAEVGVFQGASAKLICSVKGDRTFWAFDTFEDGLQDVSDADTHGGFAFFKSGQYESSQAMVTSYLAPYPNVEIRPGYFPESAGEATDREFSFIHLDVDTHDSTLACFRYFWPRMVPGGVMLTHDAHADGVGRAIETFAAESGGRWFSTTGSQVAFVK